LNKKILSLFFALSLLTTQTAQSHTEILGGELEFNVGIASNYVNRGVEQNQGQPAPFAGADFSYPIKTLGVNVYVGTWISASHGVNTSAGLGYTKEWDNYIGIKKTIDIVTLDIGYATFSYPGLYDHNLSLNNAEYYAKVTIAPDKKPYTFGAAYSLDDSQGVLNDNGQRSDRFYYEFNATYDFGPVQSKISYGVWDRDTNTSTVTLSKEFVGINFDLSYIYADRAKEQTSQLTQGSKDYLTLVATKRF